MKKPSHYIIWFAILVAANIVYLLLTNLIAYMAGDVDGKEVRNLVGWLLTAWFIARASTWIATRK